MISTNILFLRSGSIECCSMNYLSSLRSAISDNINYFLLIRLQAKHHDQVLHLLICPVFDNISSFLDRRTIVCLFAKGLFAPFFVFGGTEKEYTFIGKSLQIIFDEPVSLFAFQLLPRFKTTAILVSREIHRTRCPVNKFRGRLEQVATNK